MPGAPSCPIGFQYRLVKEGFDPQLEARPLKRLIQQVVMNPRSRLVLEGCLKPGQLAPVKVIDGDLKVESEAVQ